VLACLTFVGQALKLLSENMDDGEAKAFASVLLALNPFLGAQRVRSFTENVPVSLQIQGVEAQVNRASPIVMGAKTDFIKSLFGMSKKEPQGDFKVCVVGGAGGIGQPMSLLMAQCPLVKELSIVDLNIAAVPAEGVEADLSHVEGKCKVSSTVLELNKDTLLEKGADALTGCNVVLVPAGLPRKPGQDRKDLMTVNADIAKGTVEACAKYCPDATVALIVNPVNSIVPAMAEMWKKAGLNPKKIVGVTTLDIVRANKFVEEKTGKRPNIPVIGGHAGSTILPLFSQDPISASLPEGEIKALDERTQVAGTEVVKAKAGKGSATLSMAYAGARLAMGVLSGLAGVPVTECAYLESDAVDGLPYFSSKVVWGKDGVDKVLPIGELSEWEQKRLDEMKPVLKGEIDDGLEYAATREFAK
jgi:malate dehydrogenase